MGPGLVCKRNCRVSFHNGHFGLLPRLEITAGGTHIAYRVVENQICWSRKLSSSRAAPLPSLNREHLTEGGEDGGLNIGKGGEPECGPDIINHS